MRLGDYEVTAFAMAFDAGYSVIYMIVPDYYYYVSSSPTISVSVSWSTVNTGRQAQRLI